MAPKQKQQILLPQTLLSKVAFAFAALLAVSLTTQAQQAPSTQDGPMNTPPPAADSAPKALPSALPDGSYAEGPGITPPKIVQAVDAIYSAGDTYDAASIKAIEASKFAPGTLNGKPVPVRTHVRLIFDSAHTPATPAVFQYTGTQNPNQTAPAVLHSADPEYSEEARRLKIQGIVKVAATIGTDGVPTDVHVLKGLGHGLDEQAIASVSQYRFRPAQKDGKPIATQVNIDVNFRIY